MVITTLLFAIFSYGLNLTQRSIMLLVFLAKSEYFIRKNQVIIPKSNAINLVLDATVVDAVKKGLFHIYTVETVDDALTILMQQEAGKLSSKGRYPKNSLNYHAVNRLYNIALIVSGGDGE